MSSVLLILRSACFGNHFPQLREVLFTECTSVLRFSFCEVYFFKILSLHVLHVWIACGQLTAFSTPVIQFSVCFLDSSYWGCQGSKSKGHVVKRRYRNALYPCSLYMIRPLRNCVIFMVGIERSPQCSNGNSH